jgi:precorrin-2 dehydrogenase/sirohydrochlorin ferrochelatase
MPVYFPIALDVEGRLCVIVGGGKVAARRAIGLLGCGAQVRIVAPEICNELRSLEVETRLKRFGAEDLEGAFLAFAATSDSEVNSQVLDQARLRQILCSDAETTERGDFVVPSTVRRGDLVFAVTTGGASPALAVLISDEISNQYGSEYSEFCAILREIREVAIQTAADAEQRRTALYQAAADTMALQLIREGRHSEARDRLLNCISISQE